MILEDFIVQTKAGLFCKYGSFYLDPKEPASLAVISHAHGDHAIPGNANVYCTTSTSLFMKLRFRKNAAQSFHIKEYGESFELNGVIISFVPAGHILGSAMVLMTYQGTKYLYTGDFKLQRDDTCEPIEYVPADVLITETTFADPNTRHPDPVEEIRKINSTPSNIMLGAYSLGKSQRLISLINKHCTEKRILLHHSIVPLTRIYEEQGITLGKYELYDRKVMKHTESNLVYLVPPITFNSYFKATNVVKIFATGWKHLQSKNQIQIYLSDHADWHDILFTIDQVGPTEIWTTHGNGLQLKSYFDQKLVVKLLN